MKFKLYFTETLALKHTAIVECESEDILESLLIQADSLPSYRRECLDDYLNAVKNSGIVTVLERSEMETRYGDTNSFECDDFMELKKELKGSE